MRTRDRDENGDAAAREGSLEARREEDRERSDAAAMVDGVDDQPTQRDIEEGRLALLRDRRRIATLAVAFVLVVVAIYVLIPAVVGLDDALARLQQATWYWIAIAFAFTVAGFAGYVALFRGVVGGTGDDLVRRRLDFSASYQITMSGLAATRIFSAGGAGGIALTYWALRRAGMPRRRAACRMVAFLALLYSVYLLSLVVFGILLRTEALPGPEPFGGTVVPALIAAAVLLVIGLIALIPGDIERRLRNVAGGDGGGRLARVAAKAATGPATVATGVRTAIDFVRHPRRGALAIAGAVGWWAANIATLWASFEAFGGDVPVAVLVQGFFIGMVANLIPSPAAGVGSVDAGMIAAFLIFGLPTALVFPAVLVYRVMAFWLPIPPGVVAYFQLRRTVARWSRESSGYPAIQSEVTAKAT